MFTPMWETVVTYLVENWFELFATITGFICVYLNAKQNPWGWPIGIISAFLYIFIFYEDTFYADMVLQVIYIIVGFYGWYEWLYGGVNKQTLSVSRISFREMIISLVIGTVLSGLLSYLLHTQTDAQQPVVDASLTVFSLIAQYFLARKVLENWLIWIGVDLVYVPTFLYRERYLTAALYFAYLILAANGYLMWRKSIQLQKQTF